MNRLKKYGLTPQRMIDVDGAELEQLLYPVSFYKTKTKHIKRASQILVDKYDSDIPNNVKEMIDLPGSERFLKLDSWHRMKLIEFFFVI